MGSEAESQLTDLDMSVLVFGTCQDTNTVHVRREHADRLIRMGSAVVADGPSMTSDIYSQWLQRPQLDQFRGKRKGQVIPVQPTLMAQSMVGSIASSLRFSELKRAGFFLDRKAQGGALLWCDGHHAHWTNAESDRHRIREEDIGSPGAMAILRKAKKRGGVSIDGIALPAVWPNRYPGSVVAELHDGTQVTEVDALRLWRNATTTIRPGASGRNYEIARWLERHHLAYRTGKRAWHIASGPSDPAVPTEGGVGVGTLLVRHGDHTEYRYVTSSRMRLRVAKLVLRDGGFLLGGRCVQAAGALAKWAHQVVLDDELVAKAQDASSREAA